MRKGLLIRERGHWHDGQTYSHGYQVCLGPRLSLPHVQAWSFWGPPPFCPTEEDVKQELGSGSGLNRQPCTTHSRAKNTESSSVKVSEGRNVPRWVIMAHLRPREPCSHFTVGFWARRRYCHTPWMSWSLPEQSSAVEAECSESQNVPLLKVRVTLNSSRALLGDR